MGVTFVNIAQADPATSVRLPFAVSAGDTLVVGLTWADGGSLFTPTVSDGVNTYHRFGAYYYEGNSSGYLIGLALFYVTSAAAAAANTLTVAASGMGSTPTIQVTDYRGVDQTTPLYGYAQGGSGYNPEVAIHASAANDVPFAFGPYPETLGGTVIAAGTQRGTVTTANNVSWVDTTAASATTYTIGWSTADGTGFTLGAVLAQARAVAPKLSFFPFCFTWALAIVLAIVALIAGCALVGCAADTGDPLKVDPAVDGGWVGDASDGGAGR